MAGPFEKPSTYNGETHAVAKNAQSEAQGTYGKAKQNATENAQNVMQWGMNYDPKALHKNQNANYAKDGGQYGRFNNRDYGTTLRMARKAQAYNSMPRAEGQIVGPKGYVHNAGYGYEKPQMDTYEQKAMQQTQQLDTQQKMLAQHLQAAVNSKNLDLFKDTISQMYGINLNDYMAQQMLGTLLYQQRVTNAFSKDMNWWNAIMQPAYAQYVQQALLGLSQTNPLLGMGIGGMLGTVGYNPSETYSWQNLTNRFAQKVKAGMSPDLAWQEAQTEQLNAYKPYMQKQIQAGRSEK